MCVHRSAEYLQRVIFTGEIPLLPVGPRWFAAAAFFERPNSTPWSANIQLAKHPYEYDDLDAALIGKRNNWTRAAGRDHAFLCCGRDEKLVYYLLCVLFYLSRETNCCTKKSHLHFLSQHPWFHSHRSKRASLVFNWLHPHLDTFYWSSLSSFSLLVNISMH